MRRKKRNHSPAFKAKVAMAALQGDKTLAELSSQYDIHVNQIQTWRNQLKDNIGSLFDSRIDQRKDHEQQIKSLQAKIGQLTMENDFLAAVAAVPSITCRDLREYCRSMVIRAMSKQMPICLDAGLRAITRLARHSGLSITFKNSIALRNSSKVNQRKKQSPSEESKPYRYLSSLEPGWINRLCRHP